jgi:hypothetical protein
MTKTGFMLSRYATSLCALLSTITLKEHYVVDSLSGGLFALCFVLLYLVRPDEYVRAHMGSSKNGVSFESDWRKRPAGAELS